MGGKAFKAQGIQSDRMTADEYKEFCDNLLSKRDSCNIKGLAIPSNVAEKQDHGDIDVLIPCEYGLKQVLASLRSSYTVVAEFTNGPTISWAVKWKFKTDRELIVQVDFIQTESTWHQFAINYFSWNDAGNLFGRIAHRLGFKLGFNGLTYVLRDNTHVIEELVVTKSWAHAMAFLGYNWDNPYFHTYEQLFAYVVNNPWFNREIYLLENRNHVSRTRDMKRPTYTRFLSYLDTLEKSTEDMYGFPWTAENKIQIRAFLLTQASKGFVMFGHDLRHALGKYERQKQVKQFFNGELVGQLTGLTGPELGKLIAKIKNSFVSTSYFETFVLAAGVDAAAILIKKAGVKVLNSGSSEV